MQSVRYGELSSSDCANGCSAGREHDGASGPKVYFERNRDSSGTRFIKSVEVSVVYRKYCVSKTQGQAWRHRAPSTNNRGVPKATQNRPINETPDK